MTEWVDLIVYVAVIVLLFVLIPSWGAQLTLPMIADRNPEWFVSHRDIATRVGRSRWFLHTLYGWAAVSVATLLGITLDLIALPVAGGNAKWEILKDVHSGFVAIGLVGWGTAGFLWYRWLRAHVPLAETRHATLRPRTADDFLARPWRIAVEALTALNLGAWIVLRLLGVLGDDWRFWGYLALLAAMSALFAVFSYAVPQRRPGYGDRVFGDAYRRMEMRAVYTMRLWPLAISVIGAAELITGANLARVAQLLISGFVCVLMLMLLGLRSRTPASGATPNGGSIVAEGRS